LIRVRVGEILALERVPVAPDPESEYVTVGVRSFGRGLFHYEPKLGDQLGSLRFFELRPHRLVISNIKAWEGAVALSGDKDRGCLASNRFLTYAPVDGRIDVGWARWFFLSEAGLNLLQNASPGSADRNRTLAIKRFEALEIPLPPIEQQRLAGAGLDSMERSARAAAIRLDQNPVSMFSAALPGLIDSVIAHAASGTSPIADLVDFVSDTVHPGDDPAPADAFVGLQHIESHTGRRLGADPLGPMKGRKFRFRPGDVLYGYLRPYLNKVWAADRHGLCSVDQYVLRPKRGVSPELLAYTLRSRTILRPAIELTHSLQLPRLRSGLLSALDVPIVPTSASGPVVDRLDALTMRAVDLAAKRQVQVDLTGALVPAALNEAFARSA
jgi:type I restriction enzyme S subunit